MQHVISEEESMGSITISKGEARVQVNTLMPLSWKEKLEDLARQESVTFKKNITYQDIIRATLDEHLNLSE
jgi:hypothetical protein